MYMWCVCVLCVHIPAGNESLLQPGLRDKEWQKSCLSVESGHWICLDTFSPINSRFLLFYEEFLSHMPAQYILLLVNERSTQKVKRIFNLSVCCVLLLPFYKLRLHFAHKNNVEGIII